MASELLDQISRSEDEVSKTLAAIFASAVSHSEAELQRARVRWELGNPPGKKGDPLGDQLSWEQILTQFKEKKRVWIITRDSDYAVKYGGKGFLNATLYQELVQLAPTPDVFCFDNMPDGIRHFAEVAKVKAEALPTSEETEQIKKEQESLSRLQWSATDIDPNLFREFLLASSRALGSTYEDFYASRLEDFWKKTK